MAGVSWIELRNNKILESRLGFTRFAQLLGISNKVDPKSLGIDTGPLSPADFGVPYVYLLPGYGGYIGGVQGYPDHHAPRSDLGLVGALLVGEGKSHHEDRRKLPARLHQQPTQ